MVRPAGALCMVACAAERVPTRGAPRGGNGRIAVVGAVATARVGCTALERAASTAACISAAPAKRSTGFLARAVSTMASTEGGMAGLRRVGRVGAWLICCMATASGFSASKGSVPVSIS